MGYRALQYFLGISGIMCTLITNCKKQSSNCVYKGQKIFQERKSLEKIANNAQRPLAGLYRWFVRMFNQRKWSKHLSRRQTNRPFSVKSDKALALFENSKSREKNENLKNFVLMQRGCTSDRARKLKSAAYQYHTASIIKCNHRKGRCSAKRC